MLGLCETSTYSRSDEILFGVSKIGYKELLLNVLRSTGVLTEFNVYYVWEFILLCPVILVRFMLILKLSCSVQETEKAGFCLYRILLKFCHFHVWEQV